MKNAKQILNYYINGDLERDYDDAKLKESTVTLETALKAIDRALGQKDVTDLLMFNTVQKLRDEEKKNEQAAKNLGMTLNEAYKAGFRNGWNKLLEVINSYQPK